MRQAGQPAVDLVADAGGHPQRASTRCGRRAEYDSPGRRRARPQPGRLAGGHEPLARLLAGLRRGHSRSAACRRPRSPCWWSANWPSAASCPRTTWRWWPPSSRTGAPKDRHLPGHVVPRARSGRAPTRNRCSRRCGCRRTAKRPSGSRRGRAPGRRRSNRSKPQTQRMPPPPLYDLTELQRHANRLFGFSAQKTLDIAQALYERHKLISYPRTDSRHLSQDVARTLPRRRRRRSRGPTASTSRRAPASARWAAASWTTPRSPTTTPSFPTTTPAANASLPPDERKIYDLICRRLLSAWHDDHIWSVTTVITAIRNADDRGPLSHLRQRGAAGGLEGAGRGARRRRRRPAGPRRRRQRGEQAAAAGPGARARRRTCWTWRCCKKKTRAAQALHRGARC